MDVFIYIQRWTESWIQVVAWDAIFRAVHLRLDHSGQMSIRCEQDHSRREHKCKTIPSTDFNFDNEHHRLSRSWPVQHIMPCERQEGQVDEVGVDSHSQQQHCQLQQRVQTQEDSTSHHSDHAAQYKDLRGREGKEALTRMWAHGITSHAVG